MKQLSNDKEVQALSMKKLLLRDSPEWTLQWSGFSGVGLNYRLRTMNGNQTERSDGKDIVRPNYRRRSKYCEFRIQNWNQKMNAYLLNKPTQTRALESNKFVLDNKKTAKKWEMWNCRLISRWRFMETRVHRCFWILLSRIGNSIGFCASWGWSGPSYTLRWLNNCLPSCTNKQVRTGTWKENRRESERVFLFSSPLSYQTKKWFFLPSFSCPSNVW